MSTGTAKATTSQQRNPFSNPDAPVGLFDMGFPWFRVAKTVSHGHQKSTYLELLSYQVLQYYATI
ncbi:hypothetical protein OOU_Y34scaffold00540g34 [Pyricularia oryzae Y34]|uniref:Uncharacterized protein n=2 Tax=Pyricularia oryzae TaxID=318829 RepID=A0AA97NY69_PYRO3|nr:hypothetical protein OOU_Y34scaffold00540g34 [Pyricularia oryzae Y34]